MSTIALLQRVNTECGCQILGQDLVTRSLPHYVNSRPLASRSTTDYLWTRETSAPVPSSLCQQSSHLVCKGLKGLKLCQQEIQPAIKESTWTDNCVNMIQTTEHSWTSTLNAIVEWSYYGYLLGPIRPFDSLQATNLQAEAAPERKAAVAQIAYGVFSQCYK